MLWEPGHTTASRKMKHSSLCLGAQWEVAQPCSNQSSATGNGDDHLTLTCVRHCRHQTSQYGRVNRSDYSSWVPPTAVQHLRLQQQQGHNSTLRHAGPSPLRQACQKWVEALGLAWISRLEYARVLLTALHSLGAEGKKKFGGGGGMQWCQLLQSHLIILQ